MILETVVYTLEAAFRAQEGGADRVELCADPGSGGVTPSFGIIEVARQNINIDLFVMIRPRGGDFVYSAYEFHSMKRDITQAQKLSCDGVVTGILTTDGKIDVKRCRELIERARPLKVTCHRAFDLARDAKEALEDCIDAGFDRILTSGGRPSALEGIDVIKDLVTTAAERIIIMAGAGVNENNAAEIVRQTGVHELHFSATSYRRGTVVPPTGIVSMGTVEIYGFDVRTVDPQRIREIRRFAEAAKLTP